MKKTTVFGVIAAALMSVGGIFTATTTDAKASAIPTVFVRKVTRLYTSDGQLINNRALGEYTSWIVGKTGFIDGAEYYQVATNEYVRASDGQIENDLDNDVPLGTYQPNTERINDYFIKYLNVLRQANGTEPVHTNADYKNYAAQRAASQQVDALTHSTATRELNENLSSEGLDYLLKWGYVHSDRDVAFELIQNWYSDEYNFTRIGHAGHFGHRANLLYAGPTVGFGIANNAASFVGDPVASDSFYNLYNFTGSTPNTRFISKDSVPE